MPKIFTRARAGVIRIGTVYYLHHPYRSVSTVILGVHLSRLCGKFPEWKVQLKGRCRVDPTKSHFSEAKRGHVICEELLAA